MNPSRTFRALVVDRDASGAFTRRVQERSIDDLPPGEVLVRVEYSSLNYKDALSATGHPGVTRQFPHTPGIDAAGVVEESSSENFRPGAEVIVSGHDLGQNTSGGFARYIRVPASWVVPLPEGLSAREAMIFGTAGFTAVQCVQKIIGHGVVPADGEVLVTGSSGGVGSVSVALLARAGLRVTAATGKAYKKDFLEKIGASRVIGREEVLDTSGKPLLPRKWAAVVDTVGGEILATALRQTAQRGIVTACGNTAGVELNLTVLPFILRGVTLA
ncbi:MAG TPA: YhdH/YhfP family quinone oxidoreductase, partial [Candidatus Glassbacteria bacterium]|nr:YhdH/YhfP family quinone oxidoreductase [Candidatus Glassbacteria bacterium]